ncbi:PREDICTED: melanoma-associated antigen 3-like [Colobus angolensis palliatus]|uniref:melanoma-associated antigen 3-like n=1 Tax=Colobus angolensis palliatus TaxID=336983 RepID=UPI0005F52CA9|nr:PREDICTED: melanoma-associated antigen 3-like [Colobus angolensis palliatus]XP_011816517.1 PREDICTED: melanoma-associated antigen 3-like [Colobus angolensis palliatus]
MSLEQRSQHCKPEEGLEAQGDALGLVGAQAPATEEQETASSSSTLVEVTQREMPAAESPGPPQSPQGASTLPTTINYTLWSQSDEDSSNQEEEGPSAFPDLESGFQAALSRKVAELVHFLLLKFRAREPVTKAEMLESVVRNCQYVFPVIFSKASDCLQLVFGIELMEVDPAGHLYTFVTCLGLSCDGLPGNNQSMPKAGFLIIVLAIIAIEGDSAPEEKIWEELNVLDVFDKREDSIFADPRKLLTQDLVQENYLQYRQVPGSDPACYEFLWGPRALVETSYVKVLYHVLKITGGPHFSSPPLHEWALREGEE